MKIKKAGFYDKIASATKWNTISEMIAKLFVPVSNMLLARVLLPSEFGVVATIMMIITLIDLVAESGFQKYLIKTSFEDEKKYINYLNVAFTINLTMTIFSIGIVLLLNDYIISFLGDKEFYYLLLMSMSLLVFSSFKIIQVTVFRKSLEYKILGIVRVISVIIPLLVTLPMALLGFSYWSIIIGKVVSEVISLIMLQKYSTWKPKIKYSKEITINMLSTSSWALAETILQWGTTYLGVFYLMTYFSNHFVGVYRTAMVSTDGILITFYMPILSVMYSSLALSNNEGEQEKIFKMFHKIISMILIPAGIGIFLFKELTTSILLGSGWEEAPFFIGFWAISTTIYVLYGTAFYELYRAKGHFNIPVIIHSLYFISYIMILFLFKPVEFEHFVIVNISIRIFVLPIINLTVYKYIFKKNIWKVIAEEWIFYFATMTFGIVMAILFPNRVDQRLTINFLQIGLCVIIYLSILYSSPKNRKILINLKKS